MEEALRGVESKGFHPTKEALDEYQGQTVVNDLYQYLLHTDLRKTNSDDFAQAFAKLGGDDDLPYKELRGAYVLQVVSIHNIAQPSKKQQLHGVYPKFLQVKVTDGTKKFIALEFQSIPKLSLNTAPGTKVVITNGLVANGKILLQPNTVEVLGGSVQALIASWEANKELKNKKRLINADSADPPPIFQGFDCRPKKPKAKPPSSPSKETTTSETKKESKKKSDKKKDTGKTKSTDTKELDTKKESKKKGNKKKDPGNSKSDDKQKPEPKKKSDKKSETGKPKTDDKKERKSKRKEKDQRRDQPFEQLLKAFNDWNIDTCPSPSMMHASVVGVDLQGTISEDPSTDPCLVLLLVDDTNSTLMTVASSEYCKLLLQVDPSRSITSYLHHPQESAQIQLNLIRLQQMLLDQVHTVEVDFRPIPPVVTYLGPVSSTPASPPQPSTSSRGGRGRSSDSTSSGKRGRGGRGRSSDFGRGKPGRGRASSPGRSSSESLRGRGGRSIVSGRGKGRTEGGRGTDARGRGRGKGRGRRG